MITDAQSRMGRAAVRWTVRDLAYRAEVSAATVNRFEMGRAEPNRATLAAIQRALEAAGVEILPDNGVRLKDAQVAHPSGGSDPGSSAKPGGKPAPRTGKPSAPARKAEPAQPRSKLEQIRASRGRAERGVAANAV